MNHIFLSKDGRQRESWSNAFPSGVVGRFDRIPSEPGVLWALLPDGQSSDVLVQGLAGVRAGRLLIVLADEPSEDGAMAALAAGAVGYCNGHAAPTVLRQIASVVENGGIWVGQALMQRLLAATARLLPASADAHAEWRRTLTVREQEVALALARGASNKEIARQLEITERTVKAHVSAMLEKLGARDRLQLSLLVNGVDSKRS